MSRGTLKRPRAGLVWVGCAVVLQSASTVLGKQAGLWSSGRGIVALVVNPWYAASLMVLGLQAVVWILALRKLPLSFAYPFMSLVLPLNLAFAALLFGEAVQWNQVAGILLVTGGVAMATRY